MTERQDTTVGLGEAGVGGPGDDCPRSIGRYVVLRRLGTGGMGVVYAAYDESLDRRIAIKVLHDDTWDIDGRRRERLRREAQAMAKVTHPNVITVHEVGTADEQLFVAMEFVAGPTLREWLAKEKRSWQEIVAVCRQVADGLAAVHEAGLVHRDVKPTNVLVGEDGRVRVLDLGLASRSGESLESSDLGQQSASSWARTESSLTRTGEHPGTPAYMSPEQLTGRVPTHATDIYALSVVLYEALHGIHPFKSTSFDQLRSRVLDHELEPPPSSSTVPAWLHALVVRGLALDPADRPASMRVLSAELERLPNRNRRRWLGVLGFTSLAAVIGVVASWVRTPAAAPAACDGGAAAVAEAWNIDRAAEVRAAILAVDQPYTPALAERITTAIGEYADAWAAAHDRACQDHARGAHSEALLDARMACLDRHREALVESVDILAYADADVVEHAGQLIAGLPRLGACDELSRLADDEAAPRDPALVELESRLVRAEALARVGRFEESSSIAREVAAEAERLDQPHLLARALLGEARLEILQFDPASLGALLDRVLALSLSEGLHDLAAEAMIRRLYLRGLSEGGSKTALADMPIADSMLVGSGDDPELRALLLNNTGAIHAAAGEREAAREAFTRALVIKQRLFGEQHLEVAIGLANLGMLTSDPIESAELYNQMIAIYERWLGPDHPRTLDARMLAAFHTADPELAAAALEGLCPRFRGIGALQYAGECELQRGRIELARRRMQVARAAFVAASEHFGEAEPERKSLLNAYLSLDAEDPSLAISQLRELITVTEAREGTQAWWMLVDQAERRWLLGRLLIQQGAAADAVGGLEQALVHLEAIAEQAPPIERERLLADARATLATALLAVRPDERERAVALSSMALSFYRQWPRAYAARLDELEPTNTERTP